jgi:NADPH-dependent 7-cyano-7-deazaguanine reductase QueF
LLQKHNRATIQCKAIKLYFLFYVINEKPTKIHDMALNTIKNTHPEIKTTITLRTPFVSACPHSGEPQAGSTISVTYQPNENLIELHSIEKYLKALSGGSDALDLETVVQLVFIACQEIGISASVQADYRLRNGLEMTCECSH